MNATGMLYAVDLSAGSFFTILPACGEEGANRIVDKSYTAMQPHPL
jgi:hypothetical protein